jgi:hypothetical protein
MRNDTITTAEINQALRKKHDKDLWFEELRLSSGFAMQGRVDFLAYSVSPATGNKAIAYEVKVSRSDFRRDTYMKQRGARLYSDMFYYIAPIGVIPHDQIPDWAGLIEVEWKAFKGRDPFLAFKTVITAPKRDKEPPSWGLVCSMIRNAHKYGGAL